MHPSLSGLRQKMQTEERRKLLTEGNFPLYNHSRATNAELLLYEDVLMVKFEKAGKCLSNDDLEDAEIAVKDIIGAAILRIDDKTDVASKNSVTKNLERSFSTSSISSINNSQHVPLKLSISRMDSFGSKFGLNDIGDVRNAYFGIYYRKRPRKGSRDLEELIVKVDSGTFSAENEMTAVNWVDLLRTRIRVSYDRRPKPYLRLDRTRSLLVLVNPKSGQGKARSIYKDTLRPMLVGAGIGHDLVITTRSNYGHDMVLAENISRWAGVIIISGDGLIFEVVQGIMKRSDWEEARLMPIGVVAGGTGNGLSRSLIYEAGLKFDKADNGIKANSLGIISGGIRPMDVMCVQSPSGRITYSFLTVGTGYMSDCDIESEKIRVIGEPRFLIWALYRIAVQKTYRLVLSYKEAREVDLTAKEETLDEWQQNHRNEMHEFESREDYKEEEAPANVPPQFDLPSFSEDVPADWTTVEDDFVTVYAINAPFIGSNIKIAPQCKIDDGLAWLLVIKKGISKANMLKFIASVEDGTHVEIEDIEVIPVTAYRVVPKCDKGYLTVDGEVVPFEAFQAKVLPSFFENYF